MAVTASEKTGMTVLVLFFVTGLALLARVRVNAGNAARP
jgi:MFS-type transporter involved in bile tolerance (Atg22 family)